MFYDILERKNAFPSDKDKKFKKWKKPVIKIRNLKSRKNEMFAKLLVKNWPFYSMFLFWSV